MFVNNFNLFCPLCGGKLNVWKTYLDYDFLKCCKVSIEFFIGKDNIYLNEIFTSNIIIDILSLSLKYNNNKITNIKAKLDEIFYLNSEYDFLLTQDKVNKIFDLVKNIEENMIFE